MSLMLKGIDMPEKGETLILKIKDSRIYREYPRYKFQPTRIKDAQAIQIPKGHGRLIDADALETVFKDMAKCEWNQKAFPISWAYAFEDTIDEIDNAPTILEAEE